MAAMGAHGRRVMAALEAGTVFRQARDGGWRAGTVVAPDSLVGELVRRDLAKAEDGMLRLSPAGRGWSVRTTRPDAANRLLAERVLPVVDEAGGATVTPKRAAAARRVTVNLAESPLGWLKSRGLVDARQYEAGERLRADWEVAGLGPRVTMRWESGSASTGGALNPTLAHIAAKARVDAALSAAGPGLRDVLWRVVCACEGMETAEKALGWPARAGRLVLTLALDRVADHYRLG
jgi:hypothetical protein